MEPRFGEPSFLTTAKSMIMRYPTGSSFAFKNIKMSSTDEKIFDLATAFSSIQQQEPDGVYTVVTHRLLV